MSNLFKCLTCNQILLAEESLKHHCKPIIQKHKIISASSYFVVKDDNEITNVVIDGFDHIGYVFEIKEPKIIPLTEGLPHLVEAPTKMEQPDETTNDGTVPFFGFR